MAIHACPCPIGLAFMHPVLIGVSFYLLVYKLKMSIFVEMIGSSIRAWSFDVFLVGAPYVLHWCTILQTNNDTKHTLLNACALFIIIKLKL